MTTMTPRMAGSRQTWSSTICPKSATLNTVPMPVAFRTSLASKAIHCELKFVVMV